MSSFRSYYFPSLLRPRRTFEALMAEPRRLHYGLLAIAAAVLGIAALQK